MRLLPLIVVAVTLVAGGAIAQPVSLPDTAARAERLMRDAMEVVRDARDRQRGAEAGAERRNAVEGLDAARAALVGAEITPLMTTMGSLESKRLATDPRWAGAIVRQFAAHGIGEGATVLASFSGSFPGLNLAVMAACRAMGVRLIAISSVTASTWGANEPGFTWPEMEVMVVRAGVLPRASVAVSLGGGRDAARDLSEEGRDIARRIQRTTAEALGATALATTTLEEAVARRLEVYRSVIGSGVFSAPSEPSGAATTRKIHPTQFLPAAYVNVGGNHASLGGARATFRREEGWLVPTPTPARDATPASVTDAWLAQGVPVLNLLDVKALTEAWGLGLACHAVARGEGRERRREPCALRLACPERALARVEGGPGVPLRSLHRVPLRRATTSPFEETADAHAPDVRRHLCEAAGCDARPSGRRARASRGRCTSRSSGLDR